MAKQSDADLLREMAERTKAVEGGVLVKDKRPPIAPENVRTDKWVNHPTENPVVVHGGHNAQQNVYLIAFGVGLLAFLASFGICWFVFVR